MKYTAVYIIRANTTLESKIREKGLEYLEFMLDPQVWTNEQGGRSIYGFNDFVAAIKRLFVAYVKSATLESRDVELVFGDLTIDENSFDRWWTMEAFQGTNQTGADAIDELRKMGHADALEKVGLPLIVQSGDGSVKE